MTSGITRIGAAAPTMMPTVVAVVTMASPASAFTRLPLNAVSVWILLPPAGHDLRMFAIFLYVWFVAMVMMTGGDRLSALGCLALVASLATFVLATPTTAPLRRLTEGHRHRRADQRRLSPTLAPNRRR